MKKLKKILSVFTSVLVGGALLSSTVNACSNCNPPSDVVHGMGDMDIYTYTFNELMQMTDEEVLSIYSDRDALYITNFGDETLTDEEKFEAFCSKYDEDLGNEVFYCYKAFISGEYTDPFFAIHFKNKFKLDYSATAEDFGFPSDWKFICYTGEYSASDHFWWGDLPEYRLFIPTEVFNDYETYVRLNFAMDNLIIQDKGINYNIHDPFERRVYEFSIGPMPIEEKAFMYNELMQLTDDEIVDIFGDEYVQYGFGSDTIDDNQKFMNDFNENEEKIYNKWISGETKPFFRVITDENPNFEYNITAAGLGFPKNWQVEPDEDYVGEENLKAYDVYFSNDVLEDYEKYVRLNYALNHLLKESQYPITKYEDMFEVCNSEPPVTTTEPKATTTVTTTKAATTTPKATTVTTKATKVTTKATTATTKATTVTTIATLPETETITFTTNYAIYESGSSVKIVKKPDKLVYNIGDEIDLTGLRVDLYHYYQSGPDAHLIYSNVDPTEYPDDFIIDMSSFDNSKAGTYKIWVINKYGIFWGGASFDVTVTDEQSTTTTTETTPVTTKTTTATTIVTTTIPEVSETTTTAQTQDINGDSNGDGELNVRDAAFIARKLAVGKAAELPKCADFNGDGKINVRDAAAIASYLAKSVKYIGL